MYQFHCILNEERLVLLVRLSHQYLILIRELVINTGRDLLLIGSEHGIIARACIGIVSIIGALSQ